VYPRIFERIHNRGMKLRTSAANFHLACLTWKKKQVSSILDSSKFDLKMFIVFLDHVCIDPRDENSIITAVKAREEVYNLSNPGNNRLSLSFG